MGGEYASGLLVLEALELCGWEGVGWGDLLVLEALRQRWVVSRFWRQPCSRRG